MNKVYILVEDYADANVGEQGAIILGVYSKRQDAETKLKEKAKHIREDYKDADIDEVEGDYIDGYVEGEYIWTHDHVYIEEQEVK